MLPLIIILVFNLCMLISCCDESPGEKLHDRFLQKYPSLLHYSEWDVLQILKSTTLEEICIKHAGGIYKDGVRTKVQTKKHIRKHINYNMHGIVNIVCIDMLQCIVTFVNDNKRRTSKKSIYYLAEGGQVHSTFKLNLFKRNFYLVGEIYSSKWISWFSYENIQLSSTEEIDEDISEEEELTVNKGVLKHISGIQEEEETSEINLVRNIKKKGIALEKEYKMMEEVIFPEEKVKKIQHEGEKKVVEILEEEGLKFKEIEQVEEMKVQEMQQDEDAKIEEAQLEENMKVAETQQVEGMQPKGDLKKDEIQIEGFIKENLTQQKNEKIEKEIQEEIRLEDKDLRDSHARKEK